MITETLQGFLFVGITSAFIACLGVSVSRIIRESIGAKIVHEPVRHEAVILQFRPRSRGGRVNVR
ncbi:hypothetical protein G6M50_06230 [Agrobacterium rhizogenes]|nr:hypothetical protein [Rhizobium rhizogenes]NTJ77400.1 hypothetical protein [Rhizobium rhizogenes]